MSKSVVGGARECIEIYKNGTINVHTYAHTYMHVFIHIRIHAYIHTYVHTYIDMASGHRNVEKCGGGGS